MLYKKIYKSLVGEMLIIFDQENLLGLYLESQKEFEEKLKDEEIKFIELKSSDDLNDEKFKIFGKCPSELLSQSSFASISNLNPIFGPIFFVSKTAIRPV